MAVLLASMLSARAGEMAETCQLRDGLDAAVCQCIEDRLLAELGEQELDAYQRIGDDYFKGLDTGLSRGDAWDDAVKTEATSQGVGFITLLSRTNEIGRFHADSIRVCRS